MKDNPDLAAIESAMVAIRRRQSRRALAGLAGRDPVSGAVIEVVDLIEVSAAPTVSSVATALRVDQPRASKLVTAAVEAGLIRREADQSDGRRALLVLTEAGRALTEQVRDSRRMVFAEAMHAWTDAEQAEFARLLTRFVAALPGPPSGS